MKPAEMQNLEQDPIAKFRQWYSEAEHATLWRKLLTRLYPPAVVHQPDAMTLATVDQDGNPSARIVLLKAVEEGGFVFFTNYESRKSRELQAHPRAALVFHWGFPERQVRVEGRVEKVSAERSTEYWNTRPRGSQLSGTASAQSRPIAAREELTKRVEELDLKYSGQKLPRPPYWGGWVVWPETIEFWEGRINRLHERVRYTKVNSAWTSELLAP